MKRHIPEGVGANLRFLAVEVESQVGHLQSYLARPSAATARRILDRSGYANNLKMRVHNGCFRQMSARGDEGAQQLNLTSLAYVATHLERITEKCRDAIRQLEYLEAIDNLQPGAYKPMLAGVRKGINLVEPALRRGDTQKALAIGRIEAKLARAYQRLVDTYMKALKRRKHTEDLTHALFVALAVKQMGDSLLRASEAIISLNLGQPITFERYHSLQAVSDELADEGDLQIEPIAETRSGSAIAGITASGREDAGYVAIFKDGQKAKLKEERQGVESWHEIYPGLAPRILSYRKRGESAALLIEHLSGLTFEQILLKESPALLRESLGQLGKTLRSVWRETRTDKPVSAGFMQQLERRLPDVYRIHPEFRQGDSRICDLKIPSFDLLVKRAGRHERRVRAPFSVYIHGDFNVDNIIYDPVEGRINFIDLHRSRYMDYVQDVSVFMVSNYRLQIRDAPVRRRLMDVSLEFYRMARRFARKQGDDSFELRLALGLARSFATSTRFILDQALATRMFIRARYLVGLALAVDPGRAKGFRLPLEEIFID